MLKINEKELQKLIRFKPHLNQQKVIDCKNRDVIVCAGRGFGKSLICAYIVLKTIFENPTAKIMIVAPTYGLALKVFNYFARWVGFIEPGLSKNIKNRPPEGGGSKFEFKKRGGFVICKSAENPVAILGERYDLVIVDEAAQIDKQTWEDKIVPTTAEGGRLIAISTPFGKKTKFYEKFQKEAEEGGSFYFRSIDSPYFPKEEWERGKREMSEANFRQNYGAEFLEDHASVFPKDLIERMIRKNILEDSRNDESYIGGLDLGRKIDFTDFTIIKRSTHEVVYRLRIKDVDYSIQKPRIIAAAKRYNNCKINLDSRNIGDPVGTDLRQAGLMVEDFIASHRSKVNLFDKLIAFAEQGWIFIPEDEDLIRELETFSFDRSPSGNILYSAPPGKHDDAVTSLALAVWGMEHREPEKQDFFKNLEKKQTKINKPYQFI